jgi:hypothetical protein
MIRSETLGSLVNSLKNKSSKISLENTEGRLKHPFLDRCSSPLL